MSLVPHKIVALEGDTATAISTGKTTVASAVVVLYDSDNNAITLYDDAAFLNPAASKTTDSNGELVVFLTPGEYTQSVNGSTALPVTVGSASPVTVDTFANMLLLRPEQTGQAFTCQERANAHYILQAAAYTALAGDATFANSRVAALQQSSEGWNFNHFGVSESDNGTLNSDFFDNAITRAGGSPITGMPLAYRIIRLMTFSESSSGISSSSGYITLNQVTANASHITFSHATPNLGNSIAYPTLNKVRLTRKASIVHDNAKALILNNSFSGEFSNFIIDGSQNCIDIQGGQGNNFSTFFITSAGGGATARAGSSVITYDGCPLDAGGKSNAYTCNFSNFLIYGRNSGLCLDVAKCDSLSFTNGYFGQALNAHVNLELNTDNSGIYELKFNNIYFDGVDRNTGNLYSLLVPAITGTSRFVGEVRYNNCNLNNFQEDAVFIEGAASLYFNDTGISNVNKWGIRSTANAGSLFFTGGSTINKANQSNGYGSMSIASSSVLNVSSANFKYTTGGITTNNTDYVVLSNNTFFDTTSEINVINPTRTKQIGNVSNSSVLYDVNHITETFTPSIAFSGATTGITYVSRTGRKQIIDGKVTFTIEVALLSKGSATGNLQVLGLTNPSISNTTFSVWVESVAAGVGETFIQSDILTNGIVLFVGKMGSDGQKDAINDGDLRNSTILRITGSYFI